MGNGGRRAPALRARRGALGTRGHTVRVVSTNVEGRDFADLAAQAGVQATSVGGAYFSENEARLHAA